MRTPKWLIIFVINGTIFSGIFRWCPTCIPRFGPHHRCGCRALFDDSMFNDSSFFLFFFDFVDPVASAKSNRLYSSDDSFMFLACVHWGSRRQPIVVDESWRRITFSEPCFGGIINPFRRCPSGGGGCRAHRGCNFFVALSLFLIEDVQTCQPAERAKIDPLQPLGELLIGWESDEMPYFWYLLRVKDYEFSLKVIVVGLYFMSALFCTPLVPFVYS